MSVFIEGIYSATVPPYLNIALLKHSGLAGSHDSVSEQWRDSWQPEG